jgi:hypothetical protein
VAVFWDVVLCSLVGIARYFRGAGFLRHQGYDSGSSKPSQTLVSMFQSTQHNILGDGRLRTRHNENVQSLLFQCFVMVCFLIYLKVKNKAVPLHAMQTPSGRGGIAPTHS